MIIRNRNLVLICSFILSFLISCTENPFSDPPEVGSTQIRGQVLLNNDTDNSGVYVWLEKLGVSAYTNTDGEFLISIPPPASQGGGGGIDGDLFMYFYLANYKLDSVKIEFLNGVPLASKGDLNGEGNVTRFIQLSNLLNVRLSFNNTTISMSSIAKLLIKITLTSPQLDPVRVVVTKLGPQETVPLPAFFIRKVDSEESILRINDIGTYFEFVEFISRKETLIYNFEVGFSAGELPVGTYEVIPYLKVRDVNPPSGLLKGFGEHIFEYHPDYLNIPFKISSENITLTE